GVRVLRTPDRCAPPRQGQARRVDAHGQPAGAARGRRRGQGEEVSHSLLASYAAQNVAFWIIAVTMVVAAIGVVSMKNIVHAALALVIVLAGVAAQFLLLQAEFIGIVQVLIYIGAVVVLFLFGIMLNRNSTTTAP